MNDVTTILERLGSGKDPNAADDLAKLVYEKLRGMAKAKMAREKPGHTLQATILVNDAWLKLFPEGQSPAFESRGHFFAAAGKAMRRILVDHSRRRNALKRGKRVEMSTTEFDQIVHPAPDGLIEAVDEALKCFSMVDSTTVELVNLRFFVGLTMKDAAEALGVSLRSAERDFVYFAAWFRRKYGNEMNI